MPAFHYYSEELLEPISAERPCGDDLRYDSVMADIREARRAEEALSAGDWERRDGPKVADWERVAELCLDALRTRTKDLRLAAHLAEAALNLDGFAGLGQSLRLAREMMLKFWDAGLYPQVEAGDLYDRSASLNLINYPLPDAMRQQHLTRRKGDNYSLVHYRQAELVGSDAAYAKASEQRRETVDELRRQGYVSMDAFDAAMKATTLDDLETLLADFEASVTELKALSRAADEKFGEEDSPSFTGANEAFDEIRGVLEPIVRQRREAERPKPGAGDAQPGEEAPQPATNGRGGTAVLLAGLPADQSQAWTEAEALVRGGQVDKGLAQMAALAAGEASGRARFLRKLMLVDVCLSVKRERLAKTILQELKEQITSFRLDQWESSALVGAVWSRLYKLYRNSDMSSEQEQATTLYTQLCQLDPWQAYLHCED